jgi:hypothetical protein
LSTCLGMLRLSRRDGQERSSTQGPWAPEPSSRSWNLSRAARPAGRVRPGAGPDPGRAGAAWGPGGPAPGRARGRDAAAGGAAGPGRAWARARSRGRSRSVRVHLKGRYHLQDVVRLHRQADGSSHVLRLVHPSGEGHLAVGGVDTDVQHRELRIQGDLVLMARWCGRPGSPRPPSALPWPSCAGPPGRFLSAPGRSCRHPRPRAPFLSC